MVIAVPPLGLRLPSTGANRPRTGWPSLVRWHRGASAAPGRGGGRGAHMATTANQDNSENVSSCTAHFLRRRCMGARVSMVDYVSMAVVAAIMVYLWLC